MSSWTAPPVTKRWRACKVPSPMCNASQAWQDSPRLALAPLDLQGNARLRVCLRDREAVHGTHLSLGGGRRLYRADHGPPDSGRRSVAGRLTDRVLNANHRGFFKLFRSGSANAESAKPGPEQLGIVDQPTGPELVADERSCVQIGRLFGGEMSISHHGRGNTVFREIEMGDVVAPLVEELRARIGSDHVEIREGWSHG